jgi:hypothetical protein
MAALDHLVTPAVYAYRSITLDEASAKRLDEQVEDVLHHNPASLLLSLVVHPPTYDRHERKVYTAHLLLATVRDRPHDE